MGAARTENEGHSVVLAAGADSYSVAMVSLAVEMAASVDCRLQGLFVEDEDLLLMTGLPCTREITLTTARERPTSVDQMQRVLRSVAHQFKRTLQEEARIPQIAWSFETVRGRMRDISLQPRLDVTYTILGQVGSRRFESSPATRTRKVLLVKNESTHLAHALGVILSRFDKYRVEVTIVGDPADAGLKQDLRRRADAAENPVERVELPRTQLFDLLQRSGAAFDCAIVSQHEKPEDLLRILKLLQCPVILAA